MNDSTETRTIKPRPSATGRSGSLQLEDQDLLDVRQAYQCLERAQELFEKLGSIPRLKQHRDERRELHRDAMAQVGLASRFLDEVQEREEDRSERKSRDY